MPKPKSKLRINLNLLKPQSNPEKITVKLFSWLLSGGRYIFVVVEALVLIAFVTRFKLDADLATKKEAIEEQIPYIQSLKPYETVIRETQLKLSTISNIRKSSLDWSEVLKKIANQTPTNVQIISINIRKDAGNAVIHIIGQASTGSDLSSFIAGLKEESTFSNVNLASVGLEQGVIRFTLDALTRLTGEGERSL
ncbi:PilN domain-containing protein [Patescibacteria group bacterium]|nr:PilN domain-containing protein [Patescibacteria group bacterium]